MTQPQRVKVHTTEDMGRTVESVIADGEPRLLEKDGQIVAMITRAEHEPKAGFHPGSSPEKLQELYEGTPPLFQHLDTEKFLKEMKDAREQERRTSQREFDGDDA